MLTADEKGSIVSADNLYVKAEHTATIYFVFLSNWIEISVVIHRERERERERELTDALK